MPTPVISLAQMREWEQANWAAGRTEADIIRRVGEVVARRALALTRSGDSILLLTGKGNNGADARAAREHLTGRRVELLAVSQPQDDLPKLEAALAGRPALIVDGLFGIGLDRPLDAGWINFIQRVNESRLPVLAVDVPSGLNADTGEPQGAAIHAAVTLTVGAPKQGLLKPAAWPFTGRLEVTAEVGLTPCPHPGELNWVVPADFAGFPPPRMVATNKGNHGHLAIIAGSLGYHGAAVLAARGAQRAQPGLVTLFPPDNIYHVIASQLQAVMVSRWRPDIKWEKIYSAIVVGPGLAGTDVSEQLKTSARGLWLGMPLPVLVDASALDWLPPALIPPKAIRVLTPHPGEAARLLKTTVPQVQADRPQAVREISKRFSNCWVVLKGHQSLIGRSTGEIFVNSSGNPLLAQGGSGDLLAGYLGGLLAQPELQADPAKTICYGVWQHGAAADRLTAERRNWVVEDLAAALGGIEPDGAAHSEPA
jgi:ADP-dependent NAD(P)H-hydrate dehydratase / NAD(P)H-hydrate epimerase